MLGKRRQRPEYDEDFFAESRMSFGDHLEELRTRMWRAIKGLGLCLVIGFILDSIGDAVEKPWIGVGKPMLKVITEPVATQVREYYHQKNKVTQELIEKASPEDRISYATHLPVRVNTKAFMDTFEGLKLKDLDQKDFEVDLKVTAARLDSAAKDGAYYGGADKTLTGLGVMEAFMVYIKVSLLCGVVIACPWIFWQMWAFIGAGLYPHEKKLIHVYLPFSVFLFIGGCLMCQFLVMPSAVRAMLGFYKWINVDPDLRLNEWLGFAIVMPLVFGVSFQTPLVMMFLNRIGLFTWEQYLARWRAAIMVLAVMSALLTPSTDVISMLWLFVPTFGLYMFGVLVCYLLPPPGGLFGSGDEEDEVGV